MSAQNGRRMGRGGWTVSLMGALLASAMAAPALAADAAADKGTTLTEVVVTARKHAERLIDVPAPVTAITGQSLRQQGAVKFEDYLSDAPGVNFNSGREGSTLLILRGVATGAANPTVATYIDEAPFGSSTIFALGGALTPDLDPSDIDHVELLRGPQGTLYGANAIGGILKFVTIQPSLTRYGGRLELLGQTVHDGGAGGAVRAAVNLPIVTDKLGLRISGYDRYDPGFVDDVLHNATDINGAHVNGGRVEALWRPLDNLDVSLSATIHNSTSNNSSGVDVRQTPDCATCNSGSFGAPTYGDLKVARYMAQPLDIHYRLYNATETWTGDWLKIVSATSYSTQHADAVTDETAEFGPLLHATLPSVYPANLGLTLLRAISQQKLTQEIRFASHGEHRVDWQVGVFFTHERSTADDPVTLYTWPNQNLFLLPAPLARLGLQNVFHATLFSRYTELSGFGDVDWHITPKLDITFGARYSSDSQHFTQPADGLLYGPAQTSVSNSDERAFTWLVNPRYKLNDVNTIYLRFASGYRPGGPNVVPPGVLNFPTSFAPDFLTNYEAGWKAELFERTLSFDASIYYLKWSQMQLPTVINGFTGEANGGRAHSAGFEGQVVWAPLQGLTLSADATYTDGHVDSDNPFAGAFKGDRMPLVPQWNWGGSAEYGWEIADGWRGSVGATYRNIGKRPNIFIANTATSGYYVPLPGYQTLDLRAGVVHGDWTLELFAKNVTDERGVTTSVTNDGVARGPNWAVGVIDPRTLGASIAKTF